MARDSMKMTQAILALLGGVGEEVVERGQRKEALAETRREREFRASESRKERASREATAADANDLQYAIEMSRADRDEARARMDYDMTKYQVNSTTAAQKYVADIQARTALLGVAANVDLETMRLHLQSLTDEHVSRMAEMGYDLDLRALEQSSMQNIGAILESYDDMRERTPGLGKSEYYAYVNTVARMKDMEIEERVKYLDKSIVGALGGGRKGLASILKEEYSLNSGTQWVAEKPKKSSGRTWMLSRRVPPVLIPLAIGADIGIAIPKALYGIPDKHDPRNAILDMIDRAMGKPPAGPEPATPQAAVDLLGAPAPAPTGGGRSTEDIRAEILSIRDATPGMSAEVRALLDTLNAALGDFSAPAPPSLDSIYDPRSRRDTLDYRGAWKNRSR